VSFEYDPDGNVTAMSDGSGESTYVYDRLGRLEEATNGHGDTVAYEYNLADEQGQGQSRTIGDVPLFLFLTRRAGFVGRDFLRQGDGNLPGG
jgi:YD repeat-containing protein